MESVKVGILGAGFIADVHADSLSQAPGCEVVAVASPNLHRVVDFAKRHDIPRALTNYRDLLKIEEIDVVSLAIPNDLHAAVAIEAAAAGKHVIVEKPLATTLEDADAMIAACEEAGVQRPHSSVVPIGRDERARVVGDAIHSGALTCRLPAQHCPRSGQPIGDLIRGERAVLTFPLGDALTAGIETEAVGSGLGDPRADRGAFGRGGLVDGVGEVRGK